MKLLIGPETRLREIVSTYPGIEALIERITAIRRPPEDATVEDLANASGAALRSLLHELREFACDAETDHHGCNPAASHAPLPGTPAEPPEWVSNGRLRFDLDAAAMLQGGEHPLARVRECAAQLQAGEYIRLSANFRPAPLIAALRKSGCRVAETMPAPDRLVTYISG